MRDPELDQQPVEVQPVPVIRFLDRIAEGWSVQMDGDLLKVFGLDGLECRNDPVDIRAAGQKHQIFEFRGLGEVGEIPPRCDYVREGW